MTVALNESNGELSSLAAYSPPSNLVAYVEKLHAAKAIADAVCSTALAPKQYRDKPADGAAAILYGDEVGMGALQSLQNIYVVHGTPGLSARAMVALVISRGHRVWTKVDTTDRVVVCGQRAGSDVVEESDWTIDRAKTAGYYQSNRVNYEGKPQEMLYARAASVICRKVAPDALLGMSYSAEELRDAPSIPGEVVSNRRTAADYTGTSAPAAAVPSPRAAVEQEQQAPPSITAAQSRALHAALARTGMSDRAAGLAWIGSELDREITTTKDLTKDDASLLLDRIGELERITPASQVDDNWDPVTGAELAADEAADRGGA